MRFHGINKFLIVARLAEEKYYSIKNAIDLYHEYEKLSEHPEELSLTIVGDGNVREKLEEYVKNLDLEKSDVVMAIGRCILEAIAMKRLSIISGVKDLKAMVIPENINDAIDTNFTGKLQEKEDGTIIPEMKSNEPKELAISLKEMDISSIKNIVENNYNVIYDRLNIESNSYYINDILKKEYEDFLIKTLSIINNKNEDINENENLQSIIKNQNERITQLSEDLNAKKMENEQILNSKRWKYASKIADIQSKIKGKKI